MFRSAVILAKSLSDGKIYGYTEHSFGMGTSEDRVRVERDFETTRWVKDKPDKLKGMSPAQYTWVDLQKRVKKCNKLHGDKFVFKVFRVGRKDSPVTIDWREVQTMRRNKTKHDKFKWRNLPFKIKDNAVLNFD